MTKDRPQNRNLRPNPENLGVALLPAGVRATKAMRFTLPADLADRLERMSKRDRDALIASVLREHAES